VVVLDGEFQRQFISISDDNADSTPFTFASMLSKGMHVLEIYGAAERPVEEQTFAKLTIGRGNWEYISTKELDACYNKIESVMNTFGKTNVEPKVGRPTVGEGIRYEKKR